MIPEDSHNFLKLSSSNKFLYENADDRNIKRFSQFFNRKNALSPNLKHKAQDNNLIKNSGKIKKNRNSVDIINVFNFIFNRHNNTFEIKNDKTQNKNIKENLIINESNSLNNINNYFDCLLNTNNTNFFINKDLSDDVNISNSEEEKDVGPNYFRTFQNQDYSNKNEYALKYLSSSKPFVKLGNKLRTKVKLENKDFTDSYILALGLNKDYYPKNNYRNYENIDIIKEVKENYEDLMEKRLKKVKSLQKFTFNENKYNKKRKVKKKKVNLFLDKNEKKNNNTKNNNNNKNRNLLLLKTFNNFYHFKKEKQKIIKLNIPNYDENFAIMNIEKRNTKKKNIDFKKNLFN